MGAKASVLKLEALLSEQESDVVFAAASSLRELGDPKAFAVYYPVTGQRKSGDGLVEEQLIFRLLPTMTSSCARPPRRPT
jgi:hypothetical protein